MGFSCDQVGLRGTSPGITGASFLTHSPGPPSPSPACLLPTPRTHPPNTGSAEDLRSVSYDGSDARWSEGSDHESRSISCNPHSRLSGYHCAFFTDTDEEP